LDELLRHVWKQSTGRVVEEDARRAEVCEAPRLLDERVRLARAARAVHEADVELPPRARDRLAGLTKVRHVVERVVEAEDLDPVLRGTCDEAAHDVRGDGLRPDEEPSA
jgi:hypothetical protein